MFVDLEQVETSWVGNAADLLPGQAEGPHQDSLSVGSIDGCG